LEAGAGIVGLLKVALAIEHGEVPASLNFERPNPEIPLEALGLRVPTSAEPWSQADPVVAGVSSFGIGGTNCHVVVEEPPAEPLAEPAGAVSSGPVPWVVSGRSRGAVRDNARRLADGLEAEPAVDAGDVARALVASRTSFAHRAVVVAEEPDQLLAELRGLAEGLPPSACVIEGFADVELGADRPVFVFPGQGGQWAGMGAELMPRSPEFAAAMRACDELLSGLAGFSVEAVLRGAPGAPSLERIEVVQPVLFAVMVSLARLWQASGVQPAAVVGHSQGEIAAAHIAGGLSLEDAARIVVVRSRALSDRGRGRDALRRVVGGGAGAARRALRGPRDGGRAQLAAVARGVG
jgi:acyl transferase domain-containing protein